MKKPSKSSSKKRATAKEMREQIVLLEQAIEDRDEEALALGNRLMSLEKAAKIAQETHLNERADLEKKIVEMENHSPNIYKRMLAMMKDVQYLQKEKLQSLGYSAVSHDAVVDKIREAAIKYGVFIHTTTLENHTTDMVRNQRNGDQKYTYTEVKILLSFVNASAPVSTTSEA